VAREDRLLVHARIVEEPIRRLGAGPILAGQGKAVTQSIGEAFKHLAKSLSQTLIRKAAPGDLAVDPGLHADGSLEPSPSMAGSIKTIDAADANT
jgi:hypothetical protein